MGHDDYNNMAHHLVIPMASCDEVDVPSSFNLKKEHISHI